MADPLQQIVAVFGTPVAGNPTQYMMEAAFDEAGLDWRYLTLEVPPEGLPDAVRGARAMGFRGFNCTIPHKVAVVPLLDRLSAAAALVGAVNCVVREREELVGENTDGKGFVQSLRGATDPAGKRVVLLGAGGAARAIGVEVALAGAASVTVVNRSAERGRELSRLIAEQLHVPSTFVPWEGDYQVPGDCDVLIQATSIGLGNAQDRVPLDIATLRRGMVVADVVFNPPRTRLIRDAHAAGCAPLDGLGMLVNQAVIGFKLWTGVDANPAVMREALEEFLEL